MALDIRVHRKNMEVPQGLLDAAERKLSKLEPFLDRSGWVDLGFVEEQNPRIADKYHCEIVAHVKGKRLKVEGSAGDPFAALDDAFDKIERQARRLKEKRVKRRQRGAPASKRNAAAENPLPGGEAGAGVVAGADVDVGADSGAEERSPAIVEVRQADGKPMTPVEAAMQIELLDQEFLLFHNAETDRAAVIYRRRDGDYGLIEAPV